MTYRQSLTRLQATKQIEATELRDLTSRALIDDYEKKIKRWLACSVAEMPSPQLVMVRVTLADTVTISKFCSWLVDWYRKKTPKQPFKYCWVKETREDEAEDYQGQHYHFALITSNGLTNNQVMPFVVAKEKGLVCSWWASRNLQGKTWLPFEQQHNLPHQVHHLRTQQGLHAALQHIAYMAKVDTKQVDQGKRNIGFSSKANGSS